VRRYKEWILKKALSLQEARTWVIEETIERRLENWRKSNP
jgi:hypothetical protein